jgi:hypothetical protein
MIVIAADEYPIHVPSRAKRPNTVLWLIPRASFAPGLFQSGHGVSGIGQLATGRDNLKITHPAKKSLFNIATGLFSLS